jgi:predicted 3-demethylubiquinone-9 3-methyltransferase (glyoxalase superfamily)
MHTTSLCLWFDGKAEEAANFYVGLLGGRIKQVLRNTAGARGQEGSVLTVIFELDGRDFVALNGGPAYKFTPAISFFITCDTQAEIDDLWVKLLGGGKPNRCGWIDDKYGVSWQIVPGVLAELLQSPERDKAARAMQAMLGMIKLDIAELRRAFEGG